jgi:DNA polymerase-4
MPMIERRGITLVGVTVASLDGEEAGVQLALPLDGPGTSALDCALDEVRDRFGPAAVTRAALLGRGPSLSASLLPGDEKPGRSLRTP